MAIDRILIGSTPSIKATITVGSGAVNPSPDAATVSLYRADGTPLVVAATATDGGEGIFTYPLLAAHTSLLDTLHAVWTFTLNGIQQSRSTFHEVVGGYLCTLAQLADIYPNDTDEELADKRTLLECRLEGALNYAAVPRYIRESHMPRRNSVDLAWGRVRRLRDITIDGMPWATESVANSNFSPNGTVYYVPLMRLGGAASIGYEHGDDYPDGNVQEAMMLIAEETYGSAIGSFDTRVVRREADGQAITYASPSLSGGQFTTPALNALVKSNRRILVR